MDVHMESQTLLVTPETHPICPASRCPKNGIKRIRLAIDGIDAMVPWTNWTLPRAGR
jgi:hypothetical protein